jgi:hypothetical protein
VYPAAGRGVEGGRVVIGQGIFREAASSKESRTYLPTYIRLGPYLLDILYNLKVYTIYSPNTITYFYS